jgi:SP family general alpha glucoside:H+ symporter-like MFS transporter
MDQWAYKIPFAIQWVWPIPLITGIFFAPESPWWLVRKGRTADARGALLRLTSTDAASTDEALSLIIYTTELEKSQQAGTSYWDCFRGFDRRRTEIVCCVYAIQITCGCPIMGYSVYFMEQAGFSPANAFSMSIGQSAIGAIGTISSWFLMAHVGRRTLYLAGAALMALVLFVIGFIGTAPKTNPGAQWAIGALLLVLTFVYDITIGPVCYSLTPELSSTRLRNKSVVLARVAYNLAGIAANVLQPHMLNPTAWDWGAKSAFFWVATCLASVAWIFWRLPEPKGRTYAELDVLFRNRTPARKFKSATVDAFIYAEEIEGKLAKNEKDGSVVHIEEL